MRSASRVISLDDLGRERGARVVTRRVLVDSDDGALIATLDMTSILRAHGGFSRHLVASEAKPCINGEAARPQIFDYTIPPQTALLFRLNGDMNDLHADPDAAREAGFPQPILHGMATFGIANYMLLRALNRSARTLRELEARFTAPVFPGDTLRIKAHASDGGQRARFEVYAPDRHVKVLSRGVARFEG
ncbi:MaoC/PaaZ C-terminal domain-containing protein [Paraburkholderia phymatum]|uniref:MaoC/PaaZ C-terminal domain-containing protein n=1 Tax=Paraburkholderia phymatum TaxID=148447 RepID=UPI0031758E91